MVSAVTKVVRESPVRQFWAFLDSNAPGVFHEIQNRLRQQFFITQADSFAELLVRPAEDRFDIPLSLGRKAEPRHGLIG
nr:hypothetical protein [Paludisphaera rhizosphaerae]